MMIKHIVYRKSKNLNMKRIYIKSIVEGGKKYGT